MISFHHHQMNRWMKVMLFLQPRLETGMNLKSFCSKVTAMSALFVKMSTTYITKIQQHFREWILATIYSAMNVFCSGKIHNLQKVVNSVVPTAIMKLQTWYVINGWSISGNPCMKRQQMSWHHCQVGAIELWVLFQIRVVKIHIKNGVFFQGILEC